MIKLEEYSGLVYTIEWWPESKYITIVFNNADDKCRSSCKYESLYEAEVMVKQTIEHLYQWMPNA